MEITNKYKLPQFLLNAIKKGASEYSKTSKYSVTQVLKSTRAAILSKRHYANIEQDLTENVWQFLGSAVHAFCEKGEGANDLTEERFKYGDISGQIDFYEGSTATLYDMKVTSVWGAVFKTSYPDYQKQLSIYSFLMFASGFDVEHIKNILIFRDWKKSEFDRKVYEIPSPIVCIEHDKLKEIDGLTIPEWLNKKTAELDEAEKQADDDLPLCSDEYRWAEPGLYKIYWNESKAKKQISKKNFKESEKAEAEKYLSELNSAGGGKTYRLEFIPGNNFKRCEYCSACDFCNQFKNKIGG